MIENLKNEKPTTGNLDKIKNSINEKIRAQQMNTSFLFSELSGIENKLTKKQFEDLREELNKRPLIDLACGVGYKQVISEFNKKKINPTEYIGVDKFAVSTKKIDDKVSLVESDLIDYLSKVPDNYANITIGGFAFEVAPPIETHNDIYRNELMKNISRIVPLGGYFIDVDSIGTFHIQEKENTEFLDVTNFKFKILNKKPYHMTRICKKI